MEIHERSYQHKWQGVSTEAGGQEEARQELGLDPVEIEAEGEAEREVKVKVIGIVGSRRRDTPQDMEKCRMAFLEVYQPGDTLVSGGCSRGGDRFCEVFARQYGIPIKIHPAEWDRLGPAAGFLRNTYIAQDCHVLIAVVAPDRKGGAEDTVTKAQKMGKKIVLV